MNKLITRLAVSLTFVGGILLPSTQATAQQQFVASASQIVETSTVGEASQLRAGRADDLKNLKTSQYVAKDLNGKEYDIDALLKSGKAILMDFSAVWCGPCWELHKGGFLERIYEKFGPKGTNQIELFWVGADSRSTASAIKGSGGGTRGDWTKDSKGNPVPYPLFSDQKMHEQLGISVSGFPTVVLVGPGNKYLECRGEVQTSDSDFTEFTKLLSLFMTDKDKPAAVTISGPNDIYVGETLSFKVGYSTVAPVTKVEWKAPEGITLQKVSDSEYKITADKIGSYEIEATVTNKNGNATGKMTVTVSNPISAFPFVAKMDVKDQLDKGWRSLDHDGDGYAFDSFMGKGLMERLGLKFNDPKATIGAENSYDCRVSWGNFYPETFNQGQFGGSSIQPNNELLSAPLVIPADAAKPTFSCYAMSYFNDPKKDQMKIMVSELNGQPVKLLETQDVSDADWRLYQVDLSAYKGKTILISVIPVVKGASGLLVDQLRVTMDGSTDVETPTLNIETTLYPNPASDYVIVRTRVGSTIELFAIDGTLLSTTQSKGEETTVALTQLPAGRYLARITSLEGEVVLRPLIIE